MAKKVEGYIKLQIPAGKATPAPPVGPALGQKGVNIVEFTKQFNARTADKGDLIIPVVITVYADRSFSFITKTPPAAVLFEVSLRCTALFVSPLPVAFCVEFLDSCAAFAAAKARASITLCEEAFLPSFLPNS